MIFKCMVRYVVVYHDMGFVGMTCHVMMCSELGWHGLVMLRYTMV